jgi:hypothetical protein
MRLRRHRAGLRQRTSVRDRGRRQSQRMARPSAWVACCARSHRPPALAASSKSLWERTSVRDRGRRQSQRIGKAECPGRGLRPLPQATGSCGKLRIFVGADFSPRLRSSADRQSRAPKSRAAPAPTDHRLSRQVPAACRSGRQSATGIAASSTGSARLKLPSRGLRPLPQTTGSRSRPHVLAGADFRPRPRTTILRSGGITTAPRRSSDCPQKRTPMPTVAAQGA